MQMQRLPDDGSAPTSRADLAVVRTWAEGEFKAVRQEIAGLRTWVEGEFKTVRQEMATMKQQILSRMDRRFVALLIAIVVTNVGTERYL